MADVQTWVPKGFTEGRHPLISERLERRIAMIGTRGTPERVLVGARAEAPASALDTFFSEHASWRPYAVAPGAWELTLAPADIASLTARDDLFAWVDVAGRLTGPLPIPAAKTAAIRVTPAGEETSGIAAAIRELGGTVAGSGPDGLLARLPSERLGALLRRDDVEAIDVAALS